MNEDRYKLGQMAKMLGIHPKTLQHYDRTSYYKARRTETGRRYYTMSDYYYLVKIVERNRLWNTKKADNNA